MAQRKPAPDDGKTQHQRFIDAARRLGTDEDLPARREEDRNSARHEAQEGHPKPKP
jgi:hypothetical protein